MNEEEKPETFTVGNSRLMFDRTYEPGEDVDAGVISADWLAYHIEAGHIIRKKATVEEAQ